MKQTATYIRWFEDLTSKDVASVGGKNASLGDMIRTLKSRGIRVPSGFATTADAYREYLEYSGIEKDIRSLLDDFSKGKKSLEKIGKSIRTLFRTHDFPPQLTEEIRDAYQRLSERYKADEVDVAVRSSATAEDLPEASFAGQQETFLNITGEEELLDACRKCFASLFTDRAISYRQEHGFDHLKVALSVGVQKMVRSDKAGSGVMFTIDTDTGFPDLILINAAWGLGENIVQGTITPDEYAVFKPLLKKGSFTPIIGKSLGTKEKKLIYAKGGSQTTRNVDTRKSERHSFVLSDEEILTLARWGVIIEDHAGNPMDVEWAKDGDTGDLFIVQARPETVQSRKSADTLKTYHMKETHEPKVTGLSIGDAIAAGNVNLIRGVEHMDQFQDNAVLVTEMTDPDWVPIMKRASAIVTDHGGRTCHAAIVSRELGVPAVVGCGNATEVLKHSQEVTVSCAEGDEGKIYEGILDFEESDIDLESFPATMTKIMMNIASPAAAFRWWRLPADGIGLARMEFIINNIIKIHPMALVEYPDIADKNSKKRIEELTRGFDDKRDYFVVHLARGIARIAACRYPNPVIVRMSDFKTNEYAHLIGGKPYEPQEENPMLGFRGASRYYSDRYRAGFSLECQAIRKAREEIGMDNIHIMIPFCRTVEEADKVIGVMAEHGLIRGEQGLEVYVMCEIPSNVVLAHQFCRRFDGFSIGSNDLTQLVLGVDRDSSELSYLFDESNEAVRHLILFLIDAAHEGGCTVGICGQAPSDNPEFAEFLVKAGIDSISLNPDSILTVKEHVARVEALSDSPK
ncbi:MAG: phosphoenolpyruvate synthase [Desulfomonilia bacterium]|nr:phosphoenolpyruvate synthase [Desulfomonilia bacterium]